MPIRAPRKLLQRSNERPSGMARRDGRPVARRGRHRPLDLSNAYQLVVDCPLYRQRQRPGREAHPGCPGGKQTHHPDPGLPALPESRPSPPGGLRPALTPAGPDGQADHLDPPTTRRLIITKAPSDGPRGGPMLVANPVVPSPLASDMPAVGDLAEGSHLCGLRPRGVATEAEVRRTVGATVRTCWDDVLLCLSLRRRS